eukprot:5925524-Karenia_brevis.AAC.1
MRIRYGIANSTGRFRSWRRGRKAPATMFSALSVCELQTSRRPTGKAAPPAGYRRGESSAVDHLPAQHKSAGPPYR